MKTAYKYIDQSLQTIHQAGTYKNERIITSPQGACIDTNQVKQVLNMCANNYLGLANNKRVIKAAQECYESYGYGLSSVRFICGTQSIHKQLENKIAKFFEYEDAILYSSCFDANGGLFEAFLGEEDAIISDELNHASIIDGIRLCKAKRYRYKNSDMQDLESKLIEAKDARIKLIATDGVFSMDGYIAKLDKICELAEKHDALLMVDDSHASGFVGARGKGSAEHCGVMGRVDILTSTFGKAMGGASGGFVAAKKSLVDLLRQKSRPYLFSNTLAPAICASSIEVINILEESTELRDKVESNTKYFREGMKKLGFDIPESSHAIVPIMLYDARVAAEFAERMLSKGVYVISFSYPVVPKDKARIRTQISAAHSTEDLDFAMKCFAQVKADMNL